MHPLLRLWRGKIDDCELDAFDEKWYTENEKLYALKGMGGR